MDALRELVHRRTCARHGVPPLPYLSATLRQLGAGWPAARLDELLPER
jgi:hypothetical protein